MHLNTDRHTEYFAGGKDDLSTPVKGYWNDTADDHHVVVGETLLCQCGCRIDSAGRIVLGCADANLVM